MDRVARVRAVIDEKRAVALAAQSAGPPCRDCVSKSGFRCFNSAMSEQHFNPTTGRYFESSTMTTDQARADDGLCGPEALLFVSKSPPRLRYEAAHRTVMQGLGYSLLAFYVYSFVFL